MTDDEHLAQLAQIISEHSGVLRALNGQLAPVYARIDAIYCEIKRTHRVVRDHEAPREWRPRKPNHDGLQVRGYNRAGCEQRFGLFSELDRIAEVHGPTRNKVRDYTADMHAAKRAMERIIERQRRLRKATQ